MNVLKNPADDLGMAIIGGKEHNLPIIISEVFPNSAVYRSDKVSFPNSAAVYRSDKVSFLNSAVYRSDKVSFPSSAVYRSDKLSFPNSYLQIR